MWTCEIRFKKEKRIYDMSKRVNRITAKIDYKKVRHRIGSVINKIENQSD